MTSFSNQFHFRLLRIYYNLRRKHHNTFKSQKKTNLIQTKNKRYRANNTTDSAGI